jgi:hypothetical protein
MEMSESELAKLCNDPEMEFAKYKMTDADRLRQQETRFLIKLALKGKKPEWEWCKAIEETKGILHDQFSVKMQDFANAQQSKMNEKLLAMEQFANQCLELSNEAMNLVKNLQGELKLFKQNLPDPCACNSISSTDASSNTGVDDFSLCAKVNASTQTIGNKHKRRRNSTASSSTYSIASHASSSSPYQDASRAHKRNSSTFRRNFSKFDHRYHPMHSPNFGNSWSYGPWQPQQVSQHDNRQKRFGRVFCNFCGRANHHEAYCYDRLALLTQLHSCGYPPPFYDHSHNFGQSANFTSFPAQFPPQFNSSMCFPWR